MRVGDPFRNLWIQYFLLLVLCAANIASAASFGSEKGQAKPLSGKEFLADNSGDGIWIAEDDSDNDFDLRNTWIDSTEIDIVRIQTRTPWPHAYLKLPSNTDDIWLQLQLARPPPNVC